MKIMQSELRRQKHRTDSIDIGYFWKKSTRICFGDVVDCVNKKQSKIVCESVDNVIYYAHRDTTICEILDQWLQGSEVKISAENLLKADIIIRENRNKAAHTSELAWSISTSLNSIRETLSALFTARYGRTVNDVIDEICFNTENSQLEFLLLNRN
eukprot:TRINITY_DN5738_c0_g2_i1.p1 TRINITY_DN5738_c0_g2~~TRINITY_DN5738_c0_g2_i1.p1  ORF type:complete len:156 (-),score=8.58 TRINITY_DN5738_c0_g2_i1:100-567(-)